MNVWIIIVSTPYEGSDIVCVKAARPTNEELQGMLKKYNQNDGGPRYEDITAEPYEVIA